MASLIPASSSSASVGDETGATYEGTVGGVEAGDYPISTKAIVYDEGANGDYTIVFPDSAINFATNDDGSSSSSLCSSGGGFEAYYPISFSGPPSNSPSGSVDSTVGDFSGSATTGVVGSDSSSEIQASVPTECWYVGINCSTEQ
ncbi:uncharacterized protein KRP23_13581 [Phytophthora ramorum]|uniref:uncharacterized protein n=1 Tax=Phytophthora ramorum TaxID=164328 RepID=UPI003097DEE8|nr:hypothetical protein KRP23_13581 [Phytophthora ramorum]